MLSTIIPLCISPVMSPCTKKRSSHDQFKPQHVFRGQRRHYSILCLRHRTFLLIILFSCPKIKYFLRDHQAPPPKHSGFSTSSHAHPMWFSFPRLITRGIRLRPYPLNDWNIPPTHSAPPFSTRNSDCVIRQAPFVHE
jgi:hypothetical protein